MGVDDAGHALQVLGKLGRQGIGLVASGPDTRISIGAGWPKFNTWLTMSAGWKKNTNPGKRSGNSRRNVAMSSAVGLCLGVSEIRISPSIGPTVAESLSAIFRPL